MVCSGFGACSYWLLTGRTPGKGLAVYLKKSSSWKPPFWWAVFDSKQTTTFVLIERDGFLPSLATAHTRKNSLLKELKEPCNRRLLALPAACRICFSWPSALAALRPHLPLTTLRLIVQLRWQQSTGWDGNKEESPNPGRCLIPNHLARTKDAKDDKSFYINSAFLCSM